MTRQEIVAPSRDDTVVRLGSEVVGGPLGRRARLGSSWWTPLRVLLALTFLTCGLGLVQKDWCRDHALGRARRLHPRLLQRHTAAVLRRAGWPTARCRTSASRSDRQVEYPVLTGAVMWLTAQLVPSSDVADRTGPAGTSTSTRSALALRRGGGRRRDHGAAPADGRGTRRCSRSRRASRWPGRSTGTCTPWRCSPSACWPGPGRDRWPPAC